MADEKTEIVVLTQPDDERLELGHVARVVHEGRPGHPLVHMVCWEEEPCQVEVTGRVTVAGDTEAPVPLEVTHNFPELHRQHLEVSPLDHNLEVETALDSPIHHALQMRTPLQLRFCNPWNVASDYTIAVQIGDRKLVSVRLTGTTIGTPEPCPPDAPCPPVEGLRATHIG